jgi:signal transduction histidine kinase
MVKGIAALWLTLAAVPDTMTATDGRAMPWRGGPSRTSRLVAFGQVGSDAARVPGRHLAETDEGLLLAAAIRDVSDRMRLETLRDEFIHNAAHELRTPLAAIAAAGDLLADGLAAMGEAQRDRAVEVLRRQCERATTLVANLLDLSNLEGGRLELQREAVDVAAALQHVFDTAPAPGGTTVEVRGVEAVKLVADGARLEHVLTNLLTNAYRYGGHHLRIDGTCQEGWVRVAVSNDGPGVMADLIPRLFEPFMRGTTACAVGGSGVGLALCRRRVEAFGGEIWYETAEPHGACFVVVLPETR